MLILTIASFISAFSFMLCTYVALYFAILGNLAESVGFALIAGIWFVLMVIFGYVYLNRR